MGVASVRGPRRCDSPPDLRQFASWCSDNGLRLFVVRRTDIECFGRDLEAKGRARATMARRLCTITGFYRYAEDEGLIDHSPGTHVRRPRIDYDSRAVGLDRNELGALLGAAGLSGGRNHALISLPSSTPTGSRTAPMCAPLQTNVSETGMLAAEWGSLPTGGNPG